MIKIIGIQSHFNFCHSDMNPTRNDLREEVSFSYPCAKLGSTYQFTVTVQDSLGRKTNHEVSVDFFENVLAIDGLINDHLIDEVNKSYWVCTERPNRVYQISMDNFEILKEINIPFNLTGFSINPYKNNIYTYSQYSPEIYVYSINSGKFIKKITVPKNPWDHPDSPRVNPLKIKFSSNGIGIILLVASGSSGNTIKVIDSSDNDKIFNPPSFFEIYRDDLEYINQNFQSLETSFDLSKIYLSGRYIDGILWFNPSTLEFESYLPDANTYEFFPNRKDDFLLNVFLSELSLINPARGIETRFQINRNGIESADFSYKDNGSSVIYIKTSDSIIEVIDFSSQSLKNSIDVPYNLGGLMATLDGKYVIAYAPGTTNYISHIYRFSTKYF